MNPKDINDLVLFQIEKTNKIAKLHGQRALEKHGLGITVDQWVLLKIIQERQPLSQRELADFSKRDPASITRTLNLLDKKELIGREPIPDLRRQYEVRLSKAGEQFVKENMPMVKQLREQSVKGFTKAEQEMLIQLLVRIQENMS
ncbi:MAG: MarR family transcriptional regulator [Bacteroidota bacterium]